MYTAQNMNKQRSGNDGFTVVETLVAILVLSISIAGPLSIAFSGLRGAQLSKDEVTASYLAQEGIEFVRALRDQDYIDDGTDEWTTFLNACEPTLQPHGCWIDIIDLTHGACTDAACTNNNPVEFNATTGIYDYGSGGADSRFTRIVKAVSQTIDGGPNEYFVTSTVTWRTGTIDRSVVIQETITNWQKAL